MMKKLLTTALAASLILLSACFGGGEIAAEEIPPGYTVYKGEAYEFIHYQDWEIMGRGDFIPEFPKQTELAIRDNVKSHKFITNVTVTKNTIAEGSDAISYAKSILNQNMADVVNFKLENQEEITAKVAGQDVRSYYIVFTGKLGAQRDPLRFFQKFVVSGTNGYIITLTSGVSEEEIVLDKGKSILKSFSVK